MGQVPSVFRCLVLAPPLGGSHSVDCGVDSASNAFQERLLPDRDGSVAELNSTDQLECLLARMANGESTASTSARRGSTLSRGARWSHS